MESENKNQNIPSYDEFYRIYLTKIIPSLKSIENYRVQKYGECSRKQQITTLF